MNADIRRVRIETPSTLSYMTVLYAFQDKNITKAEFHEIIRQIEKKIKNYGRPAKSTH